MILRFRVGTPKNKNVDHQVKETCAQVAYETSHISVLRHWTMSCALNFCFFMFFYISLWQKEKYPIGSNINCQIKVCMWNQYYYYYHFDLPKITVGQALTRKN